METMREYRERCAAEKGREPIEPRDKWKAMYTFQEKDGGPRCRECPYKSEKCKEMLKPNDRHFLTDSLCWCCDKACKSGCSWMLKKVPVEGWKAKRHIRTVQGERVESYKVFKCPEFVRG
jgi:hypothetical protein